LKRVVPCFLATTTGSDTSSTKKMYQTLLKRSSYIQGQLSYWAEEAARYAQLAILAPPEGVDGDGVTAAEYAFSASHYLKQIEEHLEWERLHRVLADAQNASDAAREALALSLKEMEEEQTVTVE